VTIRSGSVTMSGFTVTGAIGEGIFVSGSVEKGPISDVVISHNRVVGNDTGGIPPHTNAALYPQCVGNPSDCGEGIHLQGVTDSRVTRNYISQNTGGVLLTDEFGATHGNLIDRNIITGNLYDCGVTVPGHNPGALDAQGNPQPAVAGVYDNVIRGNWITDNGVAGVGAGVLFAAPFAGTASYDNLATGNYIAGNGVSGVTMHAHTTAPGSFEDINGNRVIGKVIGRNNVNGDALDSAALPGSATDDSTTGILVFSGTVPVSTTIAHNVLFDDTDGIWEGVGGHVSATTAGNRFFGVGTPVFTQP
jgi:parallel beta-helix repeat protein